MQFVTIDRLNLSKVFKTDIIRRIYAWGSIVSHRGPRTDEYITWFIRGVAADLCDLFSLKIPIHRDKILKNLEETKPNKNKVNWFYSKSKSNR